jgi:signal peptidase II
MPRNYLKMLLIAGSIILCDQLSKTWIINTLHFQQGFKVTSFFNIIHVQNYGVSFGMFKQTENLGRYGLIVLMSLLVMFIFYLWYKSIIRYEKNCYALIMGGALGNIIDRSRFGYVIDFLDFHLCGYHWAAFNVADSAIVIGVLLILFRELWQFYVNRGAD